MQQLRPGTHVSAEVSAEGEPVALSFLSGRDTLIKIVAEANGYYRVTDDRAQLDTAGRDEVRRDPQLAVRRYR